MKKEKILKDKINAISRKIQRLEANRIQLEDELNSLKTKNLAINKARRMLLNKVPLSEISKKTGIYIENLKLLRLAMRKCLS